MTTYDTLQTPGQTDTGTGSHEERTDVLELLRKHRALLRHTAARLSDEQAASTPTISTLSIGGLIKHVAATEADWADFVVNGPQPSHDVDWATVDWSDPPPEVQAYADGFRMLEGETLAGLLEQYAEVAAATDRLVKHVDLGARQPLPAAPWFEPGATWSARRVFAHIAVETAQHAGHADIIRETLDGQKSMG